MTSQGKGKKEKKTQTQRFSNSPQFSFRYGAGGRVLGLLARVRSEVSLGDPSSMSGVSLTALERALSDFLRERGLGSAPGVAAGSGTRPTRARGTRLYRDSPAWMRDEESRLRIQRRLNEGVTHAEIVVDGDV